MSTESLSPVQNGPKASSRRFWVTVLCFLLLNCVAWVVYDHTYALRHRGTLRVESFDPGDNAVVDARAEIRWHFSDDVLPTIAYGKDPGRVNPAVAGRWAWENPRTLAFIPAADLPRATPVTFTLATDLLRTGTGAAMKSPYVTSIKSCPLAVESISQFSSTANDQFVLKLKFNDRVAPGDVLQHIHATLANGKEIHLHLFGQAAGDEIRLETDTVPISDDDTETSLLVKLQPGLTGLSGPLGLADVYQDNVVVNRRLQAVKLTAVSSPREQNELQLEFNNSVDIEALKKVLSVDPAVPYTIESDNGDQITLHGDFQPATRYSVHIAQLPAGATASARAKTPRAGALSAFMPDKGSDLWMENDQGYLSTAGNRTLLAHAMNVTSMKVSIIRMYDNNLVVWRNDSRSSYTDQFSKPVAERTIPINAVKNVQQNIPITLDDLLPPGTDRAGVWRVSIVRDQTGDDEGEEQRYRNFNSHDSAVVTLSDIGLTAKKTHDGLVAWATSLRTATPLANVRVRAYSSKNQPLGEAITDAQGLARMTGIHPEKDETVSVLLADFAAPATTQPTAIDPQLTWLDLNRNNWELGDSDISGQPYLRTGNAAFVYTDRGVYRPGETVHLRAIVRSEGNVAPKVVFPVKWQLRRPDLRNWKDQTVMIDSNGGAAADIALPSDLPSGQWSASISLPGADPKKDESFGQVNFQIEDFIPNRLKVSVNLATGDEKDPKRYAITAKPLDLEVQGDYLFGRPGSGLAVDISSHASRVSFAPTGWDQWTFGDTAGIIDIAKTAENQPKPARHKKKARHARPDDAATAGDDEQPASTTLDEHGRYRGTLNVAEICHYDDDDDTDIDHYHGPWQMTTQAGVREAGGRAVTVSKQIQIDALPAYIAVRAADGRYYAKPGEANEFKITLVKPDGAPDSETDIDLPVQLIRETWNTVMVHREGRYMYDSTRVLTPVSSATVHLTEGTGSWSVLVPESGQYILKATNPATGALTTMRFYATDGSGWNENVDRKNPERLQVRVLGAGEDDTDIAGKKSSPQRWHVGETARVMIAAPFAGRLLLSVETDDVIATQVIDMAASHVVVSVPVTDACWPNAFISATVIRPIDPNAKWQSHRAFGVIRLLSDSTSRQLQITLQAPEVIRPLQSLDVAVKVTDSEARPVANAAITLAAVDEGICSLTDYKTPDPLKYFSSNRALSVSSADFFDLLMPEVMKPAGAHEVGGDRPDADIGGRYRSPVGARRVKPVALAWAEVHTDADGIAHGSFPLPQFQGRLRIIAVGYTPSLLGNADRGVTVRSPILAQSSWPRFAAPGDKFTVPVVLFNNTSLGGDAQVTVHLASDERTPSGLLGFGTNAVAALQLPAVPMTPGGQTQIDLPVSVANAVGVARVQLDVTMGHETFAEEVELPVRPASPLIQSGGIAAVSTTRPTQLTTVSGMMPGTDSLRVHLTPWPTFNLPKGLDYLDRYPCGCVEQTTSTCFPLIALGDIGKTIDPDRFDPQRMHDKVDAGITHLIGMQTADGGLAMWTGATDPWPWGSVYAAHFLTEAKAAGYEVPGDFYDHLLAYVHHLTEKGSDDASEVELQSYAEYVMTLAGKPDRATLDRLTELSQADTRPEDPADGRSMRGDARLFLATAWLLAGRRDLAEGLMPDAIPSPRTQREWGSNLGSPIRDRALLILAMEQVQPNRADLPQLVQQLADQGVNNEWGSTQDVAFSVLAIGRYLRDQRHRTPYDTARLFAGDTLLGEAGANGTITWTADAAQLRANSPLLVELTGKPDASGYLSWMQTGVPLAPPKDAEHGLKIHRRYTTLGGKEIKGTVQTGELVRVELTIEGPPDQPNLVIEDLLPAGLEVENPRLETAAKDTDDGDEQHAIFGSGRVDMRDDRVIIPGRMPGVGKAHCSYIARAVTPGSYTVPPVRAEAMYDLNTNAISGSGKLTVVGIAKNVAGAE